ncbi:MAG: TonB-dependent receptor plug domain-containing protein [Luteimonas sp.]
MTTISLRASLIQASIRLALAAPALFVPTLAMAAEPPAPAAPTHAPTTPPAVASAPAEDAPATSVEGTAPVTDLSTVTVTSASYNARRDDTAAKIVVDQQELLKHGDTTLTDALKRLPGVTVGTGTPGRSGGISLRGLGNGYTQILVNGQKAPAGFDIESLSPEMIERIEIIRSATADLRAEAIAGTINIVLTQVARKDSRELKLGLGSSNGKWIPTLSWQQSQRDDYRNYTLNATLSRREFLVEETGSESGQDADGAANLLRTTALRSEGFRDVLSVAPSYNLTLENGDNFSVQGYFDASNYNKYVDIDWDTLQGPELKHVRYDQFTGIDVVQLRSDISWTHEFESAGKFTTKLSLGGNREKSKFREQGYAVDGTQNLDDRTDGRLRVHGVNSTGKYSLPALGDHSLELGWEGSVDRRRETRVQHLLPVGGEPEYFSDLSFDAQIRRLAFYGQDDWTLAPHWSMYLGLRWERIETISDSTEFDRIHNRASVLSPVLQSLWKLPGTKNDQIRLGVSRTYKSPTLSLLIPRPYTSTNNRSLNPDQQGNPDLRPELATGLDLAYEKYWSNGAQLSVSAYRREIESVIRTETRLINGRWVASPVNGGDATAWGLEMDTKFSLNQLISGAPAVDIRFNATRNWSEVDDVPGPDNRLGLQPKLSSTLGADYKISPAWTVGASYTYRSGGSVRTTLFQVDSESARREFDAYSLWTLAEKTKLRLSASNMLEQDIVTGAEYFDEDGAQQIERRRLAPVIVRAHLELRF